MEIHGAYLSAGYRHLLPVWLGGDIAPACHAIVRPSAGYGWVFLDTATLTCLGIREDEGHVTSSRRDVSLCLCWTAFLRTFTLALILRRGLTICFVGICHA